MTHGEERGIVSTRLAGNDTNYRFKFSQIKEFDRYMKDNGRNLDAIGLMMKYSQATETSFEMPDIDLVSAMIFFSTVHDHKKLGIEDISDVLDLMDHEEFSYFEEVGKVTRALVLAFAKNIPDAATGGQGKPKKRQAKPKK